MCTTTICVCRMKRTVFVIPDKKYGGSWGIPKDPGIKDKCYAGYDLAYGAFAPVGGSPIAHAAKALCGRVMPAIDAMRTQGVQDTWFLDRIHGEIGAARSALTSFKSNDVSVAGPATAINVRTLMDLKRLCRLPS